MHKFIYYNNYNGNILTIDYSTPKQYNYSNFITIVDNGNIHSNTNHGSNIQEFMITISNVPEEHISLNDFIMILYNDIDRFIILITTKKLIIQLKKR